MSDEGRLVAGRYRVVRRIGTGAMGAVWQAHDEVLARTVAIKQLLLQPGLDQHEAEDAKQRTMREGRIAARLHHPNAITVFDVVTDDNDHPCLVMEYLQSTSLAEVLRDRKTLPPQEVARIGAQIAAALKEAHAVGIVHRDIKPGNILLADSGLVKITDFGISRAKDDVTVTKTGMIAGTPAYLAPEVAIGGEPGPEADVFSLGSTLYAACEGQPPFGLSENTLSLLHAVAAGQINPPRQSGPLASVLAVLLHPEVSHRPTAAEAEELLDAVGRGETPLGGPADPTQIASPGMLGAAAAGAAAGAGATRAFSGSLGNNRPDDFYDDYEDDYADDGTTAAYPTEDYDGRTRAVPAGYAGYDDEDPAATAEDEDEKPGKWKVPAAIGGVVVIGLIALGVWLFNGPDRGSSNITDNQPVVPPPATTSSLVQTTESATETGSTESSVTRSTRSSSRRSSAVEETTENSASSSRRSTPSSPSSKPSSPPPSDTASPTGTP
ncbi:serine/threonine protein kinase [Amycolatopsis acidiphila]|uniref:non-specific serine/threonine protein kinase n=1 Tax=Amycolatopsis acidiphila TaxID=715473 RepID=A0A557ZYG2_9PSEU|nr:serine/threonine-protein kinase [Amycolatopsis acidiphila]TVT17058.1 serine/threonine protein kinase [Amycolatopsis acidiphila]UIJ60777.1 serine/threonine protein kinase [Amycolatopsis acidiphila]GHG90904.1 serine/threonine protein kinase [Amycolatopsis acidiphila]